MFQKLLDNFQKIYIQGLQKMKGMNKGERFLLVLLVLFSLGFSSVFTSASSSCMTGNLLMSYESGQSYADNWGANPVCSQFSETATISDGIALVRLSSASNAHAQNYTYNDYSNVIYIKGSAGASGLSVNYRAGNCNGGEEFLFTISGGTNAHIGSLGEYATSVCLGYSYCNTSQFINGYGFRIKDYTGADLLAIDGNGMMLLRGEVHENDNTPPTSNAFEIKNSVGITKIWLSDSGELYLADTFSQNMVPPITPSDEMIIKNIFGSSAAVFYADIGRMIINDCVAENHLFS